MYHKRHIEKKLLELTKYFKVILVVGARQVGKSTLLSHLFPNYQTFVFDPIQDLYGARKDPDLFLKNFPTPLILDEIQYAPELLPALKRKVDQESKNGLYFLTGSQNISILKTISESLAGRVAILHLPTMSTYEIQKISSKHWLEIYLNNEQDLLNRKELLKPSVLPYLWRGGLPGLLEIPDHFVNDYFSSYVQTYVERDIRLLENIKDMNLFDRFLGIVSALNAQKINHSQIGRELGLSPLTANNWLSLLQNTYQWIELFPYSKNTIKTISKKKKGFVRDTGLACYLQRINSIDALARQPTLGSLFESFCLNNILALKGSMQESFNIYHWRTKDGAEVDFVLEKDGILYPIEIKYKTNLNQHDTRGLRAFRETYSNKNIATALIIYAGDLCYKLNETTIAMPWNY